jgi:serine phosphatase RsbU (regulator of sigma subunit)/CBS domain-containing protein
MMRCNQRSIRLSEIVESVPAIQHSVLGREVMVLFRTQPMLHGLAVMENGHFAGIVRKSQFYRDLSRAFALELFSRRPIRFMMDANPICMEPDLDINTALSLLLQSDPAMEIDSFPVVSEGICLGIVTLSSLMMHISRSQSQLLQILEGLNARMHEEVCQAARIQQALLPARNFKFPGLTLAADIVTSTEIGGDFFDYFMIADRKICLVIADVSGHGVQAGMVTTAAKASLHTLIHHGVATPAGLLQGMNGAILATAHQNLLMTCLVVIADFGRRCCSYANAGHTFPYFYSRESNKVAMLQPDSGFPLGLDADAKYVEHHFDVSPGDMLILYSDGVHECSNGSDIFGFERFEDCLADASELQPEQLVQEVLNLITRFSGRERFEDDVTLLAARFEEDMGVSCHLALGHPFQVFGGVA